MYNTSAEQVKDKRENELNVTKPSQDKPRETIYNACRQGDEERLLTYISCGGRLTEQDENGMTLLHHAAFAGNVNIIRALLESNTEPGVSCDTADKDGWTALHYACDRGFTEIVKLFIEEYGANVNARDVNKRTPLHLAALQGHGKVIQLLLAHGAVRGAKNVAQMTPAQCALLAGHDTEAKMLEETLHEDQTFYFALLKTQLKKYL